MTWLVQRAVGWQTATALTLFGEPLDAAEAVRTGLAHRLIDVDADPRSPAAQQAVVAAAVDLARRAADAPRELVIATKTAMRATATMPQHADAVTYEIAPQLASLRSRPQ
jgi:enoyl-CoA hydratase